MSAPELIRKSFDATFAFYASRVKFFNTSVIFAIVTALVVTVIIAPIYILLFMMEIGIPDLTMDTSFFNPFYLGRFVKYGVVFYFMLLPVFGIYAIKKQEEPEGEKELFMKGIFDHVNQNLWLIWAGMVGFVLLFYTLTFTLRFGPLSYNDYYLYGFNQSWSDSILELFKDYLPVIFSMVFTVLYFTKGKLSRDILWQYKNAFIASVIVSFIINSFAWRAVNYYDLYIQSFFLEIPFINQVFPMVFGVIIKLAFLSYVFPAIAIIFTYPFKVVSEQNQEIPA